MAIVVRSKKTKKFFNYEEGIDKYVDTVSSDLKVGAPTFFDSIQDVVALKGNKFYNHDINDLDFFKVTSETISEPGVSDKGTPKVQDRIVFRFKKIDY